MSEQHTDSEKGYVDYFRLLEVDTTANPGDVRKEYKRKMKALVQEIAQSQITEDRRARYLLEMAQLNAALYVLRDKEKREDYLEKRKALIALEQEWRAAPADDKTSQDRLRRQFDTKIRDFLATYVEEAMLEAGRDKECVEASHWDPAHERHATKILRHYRHGLYHDILERLPYYEVTPPKIDWDERRREVAAIVGD